MKLRLPEDLKSRLEDRAKSSGRSLNAEVVARLEASFLDVNQEAQRRLDSSYADVGVTAPLFILGLALDGKMDKDAPLVKTILEQARRDMGRHLKHAHELLLEKEANGVSKPASKPPRAKR